MPDDYSITTDSVAHPSEAEQRALEKYADVCQVERIRRWHALDEDERERRRRRWQPLNHAHHHLR